MYLIIHCPSLIKGVIKVMVMKVDKDLLSSFKSSRRTTEPSKEEKPKRTINKQNVSPYSSFLFKYEQLDEYIDTFGTRDLIYYFRQVAEECGYKYTISNIKKDMAIFKRLRDNYDTREICSMIEFLFRSEQDYLEKDRLSPNILASQWINTIYADMQLWVKDEYKNKKTKKNQKQREWSETKEDDVSIGGWD